MTTVVLRQRILINGLMVPRLTPGTLIGSEHPASWDGGAIMEHCKIHLIRFENIDSAVGPAKVWLTDEQILILDGTHAPWDS